MRTAWYAALALLPAWPAHAVVARPKIIASIRLPFTSSASPAVGRAAGRTIVAVTSDNIGDITRQREDPRNVNGVYVFRWDRGALRIAPGWPRKTRDATLGLSIADAGGGTAVFASCGQDAAPPLMEKSGLWLTSRLYAWRADGTPMPPWYPAVERSPTGQSFGHAFAAPVAADIDGDGVSEILQASQGAWEGGGFQHGSIRAWSAGGRLLFGSQGDSAALPWYTLPGFAMDAPPVIADLDGAGHPAVVAPTFGGRIYAWSGAGKALPGWFPSPAARTLTASNALLRGAAAAANVDGRRGDEILAGGYDGALYCFTGSGRLLWRSMADSRKPAPLTSGVAAGRLRRGSATEIDAVAGDAAGYVTAWRPNGAILWRACASHGMPLEAEPAIGDVNADGTQDVVVGGTDGAVSAFDGETGSLLWRVIMPAAPTLEGMRPEGILGAPALCDLRGDGHLCVVIATAQRYVADVPTHRWQGFGHLVVLDCGPRTFHRTRLDWPQYRHDAARTGRLITRLL